jgi:hypothetical protein
VIIDRGTDQGVRQARGMRSIAISGRPGCRWRPSAKPVVLSTGKTLALTKITRARDAVLSGDYVAPRR